MAQFNINNLVAGGTSIIIAVALVWLTYAYQKAIFDYLPAELAVVATIAYTGIIITIFTAGIFMYFTGDKK